MIFLLGIYASHGDFPRHSNMAVHCSPAFEPKEPSATTMGMVGCVA